jgi:hypothetical protein
MRIALQYCRLPQSPHSTLPVPSASLTPNKNLSVALGTYMPNHLAENRYKSLFQNKTQLLVERENLHQYISTF